MRWAAAGALLLGALAGCGGSDEGPDGEGASGGSTTSSEPSPPFTGFVPGARSGPNPPPIESFEVPESVACAPGGEATVTANYRTDGAMTVTFLVDVDQIEGYPPQSGSFDLPVPCDGGTHRVTLIAVGNDMSTNTDTRDVRTGG